MQNVFPLMNWTIKLLYYIINNTSNYAVNRAKFGQDIKYICTIYFRANIDNSKGLSVTYGFLLLVLHVSTNQVGLYVCGDNFTPPKTNDPAYILLQLAYLCKTLLPWWRSHLSSLSHHTSYHTNSKSLLFTKNTLSNMYSDIFVLHNKNNTITKQSGNTLPA